MQYPVKIQETSIEAKLSGMPFLKCIPRQIQQHWWKAFITRCREESNWTDRLEFYKGCWTAGQLPVTKRRIFRESWTAAVVPYLPFALTVKPHPFSLE
jgi:hypothetical protein